MENNQENIPPVIQPQPPEITNKNWFLDHKFLWPVFGIAIIVGVFFYFKVIKDPCYSEKLGAELGPECANSLIPENFPSQSDEILTWKTYTNEEYNFEVKYPKVWTQTWNSYPEYKKTGLGLNDEKNNFSINFNFFGDVGDVKPTDIVDINIGGLTLKRLTYAGTVSPGKYNVIAKYCTEGEKHCEDSSSEAKYTNIVFDLECEMSKSSKEECNNLFDKIVSTFKFIQPQTTPTTQGDLKIYRDEINGFEFQYPSDWSFRDQLQDVFKTELIFKSGVNNEIIEFILVDDPFIPCEEDCVNIYSQNISGNIWTIYDSWYGGEKGKAAVLKKNNLQFVFISSKSVNFNSATFDGILSTFKFIN